MVYIITVIPASEQNSVQDNKGLHKIVIQEFNCVHLNCQLAESHHANLTIHIVVIYLTARYKSSTVLLCQ